MSVVFYSFLEEHPDDPFIIQLLGFISNGVGVVRVKQRRWNEVSMGMHCTCTGARSCAHTLTYMYTNVFTHNAHIRTHARTRACTHTHAYMHACTHAHTRTCTHMHTHIQVYLFICFLSVCMSVYLSS